MAEDFEEYEDRLDEAYYEHEFGHLPEAEKLMRIALDNLIRAFILGRATDKTNLTPEEVLELEAMIQVTVEMLQTFDEECEEWGVVWG